MIEELKHIIAHIDWGQFHFLRSKALYLFIPLGVIVLLLIISNRERKKWKTLVSPALRPYMFTHGSWSAIILPLAAFIVGMSCVIIGLAGPTWEKKKIPGQKIQAVVLIALDLSKSMEAKDIQPNRLERGKFKINDFLDANPRARAGLIAFAGTAHPVLPFTSDYRIIKSQAVSLENRIMPVQGSNLPALVDLIDTMMKEVIAPSTVLLLTDAIDNDDATVLSNWVNGSVHHLEILLLSTPNGAPVPGYPTVLSKQDPAIIQNLVQDPKVTVTPLTLDKSDVTGIAKRISDKLVFEKEDKKEDRDWDDMGWVLIIPALIIAAFWFRKGWVIQWCWLPLSFLLLSSCGIRSKHPDWWYSKDYQGQLFSNAGRYEEAADRFEDDNQKAVAYFKAGNFEAAADLFSLDTSAAGNYNRGLALVKMGRYTDAENAFDKAIDLDPSMADRVKKSLTEARAAKQRADSVIQFDPNAISKNTKDLAANKKREKDDPLKTHKPDPQEESLSSDTRVKKMPKFGDRSSDEVATNMRKAKEASTPPTDFEADKADKLASNILLRRAEADPSEFLHKRFLLQEKRQHKKVKKSKDPW